MRQLKVIIVVFSFLLLIPDLMGQIIDSKKTLSFSAGNAIFAGKDNLFFPKRINSGSLSFRGDYLSTVLPWLKMGIEGSLLIPRIYGQNDLVTTISSKDEKFITAGFNTTFYLPYKASGWRNRLRLQFGAAPLAVVHLGERTVSVDNKIWNIEEGKSENALITMKGPKATIGLSFTPSIEYYVAQNTGIRFSFNSLLTSMKSEFTREDLIINSLNIGLFVQLSKRKELNY